MSLQNGPSVGGEFETENELESFVKNLLNSKTTDTDLPNSPQTIIFGNVDTPAPQYYYGTNLRKLNDRQGILPDALPTRTESSLSDEISELEHKVEKANMEIEETYIQIDNIHTSSISSNKNEKKILNKEIRRLKSNISRRRAKVIKFTTEIKTKTLNEEIENLRLKNAALIKRNIELEEMLTQLTYSHQIGSNYFMNPTAPILYQYGNVSSGISQNSIQNESMPPVSNSPNGHSHHL